MRKTDSDPSRVEINSFLLQTDATHLPRGARDCRETNSTAVKTQKSTFSFRDDDLSVVLKKLQLNGGNTRLISQCASSGSPNGPDEQVRVQVEVQVLRGRHLATGSSGNDRPLSSRATTLSPAHRRQQPCGGIMESGLAPQR